MASSIDKLATAPTSSKVLILVLLLGLVGAGWWTLFYGEALDKVEKANKRTPELTRKVKKEKKGRSRS